MLEIKNDSIRAGGVTFKLPNGFFIDSFPDPVGEDFLALYPPDKSYCLNLAAYKAKEPAFTKMSNEILSHEYDIIEPVQIIYINGMTGCRAIYRSSRYSYYEVNIDTPVSQEGLNAFSAFIYVEGAASSISEIARSTTVNKLLNNIFPAL